MTSATVGWALGANNLQHTSNGGQSWQVVAQTTTNQAIGPFFVLDGQTAWYTLIDTQTYMTAALLSTNDGGQSWTRYDWISSTQYFNTISIFDQHTAWINTVDVSGNQPVYHLYLVGGSTPWQEVTLPGTDQVTDIHFISQMVGWVTTTPDGSTEELYMTTDGGQSWTTQTLPYPTNVPATDAISIQFLGFGDSQTGFLRTHFSDPTTGAIDSNQVYATFDGGQSWQPYGPTIPMSVPSITQIDNWSITNSFPSYQAQTNVASLFKGAWKIQSFTSPTGNNNAEITILSSDVLFASTISADRTTQVVYKSSNGGETWHEVGTLPFTV